MTPEIIRSVAQALLSSPQPQRTVSPFQPEMQAARAAVDNMPLSNETAAAQRPLVAQAQSQEIIKAEAQRQLAAQNAQAAPAPAPGQPVAAAAQPAVPEDLTTPIPMSEDDTPLGPDGLPLTPEVLIQQAKEKRDSDLKESSTIAGMQRKAAADTIAVDRDIQKASQPAEDVLHNRIEKNYNDLQGAAVEVDEHAKAAIADYQQVQVEMKKHALSQPQDIWGQSGVNKMMGTAAIFFGGYGVNGRHANHNLEMINSMADRAVAAQKERFEQLKAVGEGDRTLYGMLQQRLQNAQAVSGTLKNMALESYTGTLRSIANQYADPKWKAAVETQAAKIREEQNARDVPIGQSYINNSQNALKLLGHQKALEVAQVALKQKQDQKQLENGIAGYKGYMGNKSEHAKVAEMVSGGRTMIAAANHMANALNSPMTVAKYRQLITEYALQFSGARKFLQTGTRIEEGEQKIIDALNLLPSEATMASLSQEDISGIRAKLDAIRFLIREGMDINVDTYAPGTMVPDENDPITGPWGPSRNPLIGDQETAALTAKGANPAAKGQFALDALPNADGTGNAPPAVVKAPDERFAG